MSTCSGTDAHARGLEVNQTGTLVLSTGLLPFGLFSFWDRIPVLPVMGSMLDVHDSGPIIYLATLPFSVSALAAPA